MSIHHAYIDMCSDMHIDMCTPGHCSNAEFCPATLNLGSFDENGNGKSAFPTTHNTNPLMRTPILTVPRQ